MTSPNLLSISTTNTQLKYNIQPGTLQNPHSAKPMGDITTDTGGIEIKTDKGEVQIDNYPAESSMGYGQYKMKDFIKAEVQKGESKAAQGTRDIVNRGNALQNRMRPSDLAYQDTQSHFKKSTETVWYPSQQPEVNITKTETEVTANKANVQIDWKNTEVVPLDFNRGAVTFDVTQKANVNIEYLGDWDYFPELDIKV